MHFSWKNAIERQKFATNFYFRQTSYHKFESYSKKNAVLHGSEWIMERYLECGLVWSTLMFWKCYVKSAIHLKMSTEFLTNFKDITSWLHVKPDKHEEMFNSLKKIFLVRESIEVSCILRETFHVKHFGAQTVKMSGCWPRYKVVQLSFK